MPRQMITLRHNMPSTSSEPGQSEEVDVDDDYNNPPPSYDEVISSTRYPLVRSASTLQVPEGAGVSWQLSFVDFTPHFRGSVSGTGRNNTLNCKHLSDFGGLVQRANNWLRRNTRVHVNTCETVTWTGISVTELMETDLVRRTTSTHASTKTRYLRGLRLWLMPRSQAGTVVQVGIRQFAPKKKDESFQQVIRRANKQLKKDPIPGRILTVETVCCRTKPQKILANSTYWNESSGKPRVSAYFLRVFFIHGPTRNEDIGLQDFCPQQKPNGDWENYNDLVTKSHSWVTEQQNTRVTNMQAIWVKVKGYNSGFEKCFFKDGDPKSERQRMQILRLTYVRTRQEVTLSVELPHKVTKKTFAPALVSTSTDPDSDGNLKFESFTKTVDRVSSWLDATGAELLNVETLQLRLVEGAPPRGGPECTRVNYSPVAGSKVEQWLTYIRVYLKGDYRELRRVPSTPTSADPMQVFSFFHRRSTSRRNREAQPAPQRRCRKRLIAVVTFVLVASCVGCFLYFALRGFIA